MEGPIVCKASKRIRLPRRYIELYETESGLFNKKGDIEKGREIFYNVKASLYLSTNRLDSAEYWYRKELSDGKDFNNQNGGALGLAMVYERRHMLDSAAKYYKYAYAMNDSMFSQMTTRDIEQLQNIYNYNRYREMAVTEKEKASRRITLVWICIFIIAVICLTTTLIIERINHKRQELKAKYTQSLNIIRRARQDIRRLETNQKEYAELIAEKEKDIRVQANLIKGLPGNLHKYERFAVQGQAPTSEEWLQLEETVFDLYPQFHTFIENNKLRLNEKKLKTCILIRAGFKPKNIGDMLDVGPSYIYQISERKCYTIFLDCKEHPEILTNS